MLSQITELADFSFGPCTTIGVLRDGKIVGGVAYSHFHKHPDGSDIAVNIALLPEARITKSMWRWLFSFPFQQLQCSRITSFVIRSNKRARKFNERLGFKLEGIKRRGHGRDDVFMFGMLASECRFWSPN